MSWPKLHGLSVPSQIALRRGRALILVALVAIGACTTLVQSPNNDAQAITSALAAWREAANAGNWRVSGSFYAEDLITEFPGRPTRTYADIARSMDQPPNLEWRHDFEIKEVLVEGDLAVVRVGFTSERRTEAGWVPGESIMTMQVWRRDNGRWRIIRTLSGRLPDE